MHQQPGLVLSRDLPGDSAAFCSSQFYIHNVAKPVGFSTMSHQRGHSELRPCKDPLENLALFFISSAVSVPTFKKKKPKQQAEGKPALLKTTEQAGGCFFLSFSGRKIPIPVLDRDVLPGGSLSLLTLIFSEKQSRALPPCE